MSRGSIQNSASAMLATTSASTPRVGHLHGTNSSVSFQRLLLPRSLHVDFSVSPRFRELTPLTPSMPFLLGGARLSVCCLQVNDTLVETDGPEVPTGGTPVRSLPEALHMPRPQPAAVATALALQLTRARALHAPAGSTGPAAFCVLLCLPHCSELCATRSCSIPLLNAPAWNAIE